MATTNSDDYNAGYSAGLRDGENDGRLDGYAAGQAGTPQSLSNDTGSGGSDNDYSKGYAAGFKTEYDSSYAKNYALGQKSPTTPSTGTGTGTGTGTAKTVAVDAKSLLQAASDLRFVANNVETSRQELSGVQVLAGDFYHGKTLSDTAGGWGATAGRAAQFYGDLDSLVLASNNLADDLEKAAKSYSTTEEINKNLVDEVNQWLTTVQGELNLTPSGPAVPTTMT
jgi:hypothetical protein